MGVLYVNDMVVREFTYGELELLKTFASQAAVLIHNARRLAEQLRGISGAISSAHRLTDIAGEILDGLKSLVGYQKASFQLIEGDARTLLACRGFKEDKVDRDLLRPITQDRLIKRAVGQNRP